VTVRARGSHSRCKLPYVSVDFLTFLGPLAAALHSPLSCMLLLTLALAASRLLTALVTSRRVCRRACTLAARVLPLALSAKPCQVILPSRLDAMCTEARLCSGTLKLRTGLPRVPPTPCAGTLTAALA
jgi:hypothetical protein